MNARLFCLPTIFSLPPVYEYQGSIKHFHEDLNGHSRVGDTSDEHLWCRQVFEKCNMDTNCCISMQNKNMEKPKWICNVLRNTIVLLPFSRLYLIFRPLASGCLPESKVTKFCNYPYWILIPDHAYDWLVVWPTWLNRRSTSWYGTHAYAGLHCALKLPYGDRQMCVVFNPSLSC